MFFLFKLLPSWVPIALSGVLIAGLAAGYLGWVHHQREIGRAEIIAKDAKALADQKERDAKLSADLVMDLREKLSSREATAAPVRERIIRVGTECSKATGPDAAAAAGWVSNALSPAGGPAARRKPAP